ncbi:YihY/virulence factor BrkB family protein [Mucilaginibacter litoreus]|uniref:YihY/virulence factor BrkB family protein n=2 Tax=Mucilaginibacter litoreus TaxID=1048221 RepID=A0ABW3AQW8_9SPHI
MQKITLKNTWELFKDTGKGFVDNKVTKLSASLAYYTIFSLGPMLMVIIFLSNLLWREQAMEGLIYGQIKDLVGNNAALQIQEIIKNAAISGNNTFAAIVGFVTLLIGATTVFAEIQDSINAIWRLKVKTDRGWLMLLKNRLLSFSLVVSMAFLLLVSLIINGLLEGFMDKLNGLFPHAAVVLIYIVNLVISLIITASLFAIIFKLLPDAVIRWKDVIVGALFTASLFMLGRFAIAFYIGNSHPGSAYGTAGSIIVLLLWIYFSAIILYFGAVFTKCYAIRFGGEITPDQYAVTTRVSLVESEKRTLQENEQSDDGAGGD